MPTSKTGYSRKGLYRPIGLSPHGIMRAGHPHGTFVRVKTQFTFNSAKLIVIALVSSCGTQTGTGSNLPDSGAGIDAGNAVIRYDAAFVGDATSAPTSDAAPAVGDATSAPTSDAAPAVGDATSAPTSDAAPAAVDTRSVGRPDTDMPRFDTPIAVEARRDDASSVSAPPGDIGTWTDTPGECPAGFTQIDVTTLDDLQSATRGEDSHSRDPADACYLIHDAVYKQSGSTIPFYVRKGGASSSRPRIFLGQSRTGTVIRGRGVIEDGVSHVVVQNLTFDLNGYSQSGSFNTLDISEVDDILVSHVTFTGDCQTGANGGHIEFNGARNTVIDNCLVEKFGRCGPDGHQDHGIYIASGTNLTIRGCEIRGNASRGIQVYTQQGDYGTVDGIVIANNRIHDNGHANYEDGIVFNGGGSGPISNVTVEHNLIYGNYYSGIRTVDTAYTNVIVRKNTFYRNGMRSSGSGRGEIVLDESSAGKNESFTSNILFAGAQVINSCPDSTGRNYQFSDNVVQGTVPSGAGCMTGNVVLDPLFVDAEAADFHTSNPAAAAYGAYAP
jgi:hypothetical protein